MLALFVLVFAVPSNESGGVMPFIMRPCHSPPATKRPLMKMRTAI